MNNVISHHGILGQKWGIRRFQNPDGSLTQAGKKRYEAESVDSISSQKGVKRRLNDLDKAIARNERENADAVRKIAKKSQKWHPHYGNEVNVKDRTEKAIAKGKKEIEKIMSSNSDKYDIKSYTFKRNVTKGKDIAKGFLTGAALNLAVLPVSMFTGFQMTTPLHAMAGAIGGVTIPRGVSGKHYSVKEKKDEQ